MIEISLIFHLVFSAFFKPQSNQILFLQVLKPREKKLGLGSLICPLTDLMMVKLLVFDWMIVNWLFVNESLMNLLGWISDWLEDWLINWLASFWGIGFLLTGCQLVVGWLINDRLIIDWLIIDWLIIDWKIAWLKDCKFIDCTVNEFLLIY